VNGKYIVISNFYNRLKNAKVKDGVGIMFWPDGTKYEG
jgi:hypothetical protein